MSTPNAEQIVKALEGLHARVNEVEKQRENVGAPVNQETINAFFAPRNGKNGVSR